MEKFFKFKELKTNMRTELNASLTTFLLTAYVIFLNPLILSGEFAGPEKGFFDFNFAFVATAFVLVAAAPNGGITNKCHTHHPHHCLSRELEILNRDSIYRPCFSIIPFQILQCPAVTNATIWASTSGLWELWICSCLHPIPLADGAEPGSDQTKTPKIRKVRYV